MSFFPGGGGEGMTGEPCEWGLCHWEIFGGGEWDFCVGTELITIHNIKKVFSSHTQGKEGG